MELKKFNPEDFGLKIGITFFVLMIIALIVMFLYEWFEHPPILEILLVCISFLFLTTIWVGVPAFILAAILPKEKSFLFRYVCSFIVVFIMVGMFLIVLNRGANRNEKWVADLKTFFHEGAKYLGYEGP